MRNNYFFIFLIFNLFSSEKEKVNIFNIFGTFYTFKGEKKDINDLKIDLFKSFSNGKGLFEYFKIEITEQNNLNFFKNYFIGLIEKSEKNISNDPIVRRLDKDGIKDITNQLKEDIDNSISLRDILLKIPKSNLCSIPFEDENEKFKFTYSNFSLNDLFNNKENYFNICNNLEKLFLKNKSEDKNLESHKKFFLLNELEKNFKENDSNEKLLSGYLEKILEVDLSEEYKNFLIKELESKNDQGSEKKLNLINSFIYIYYYKNFSSINELISYLNNNPELLQISCALSYLYDNYIINNEPTSESLNALKGYYSKTEDFFFHELGHVFGQEKGLLNNLEFLNRFKFIIINNHGLFLEKEKIIIGVSVGNDKIISCNSIFCKQNTNPLSGYTAEDYCLSKLCDNNEEVIKNIRFLLQFTKFSHSPIFLKSGDLKSALNKISFEEVLLNNELKEKSKNLIEKIKEIYIEGESLKDILYKTLFENFNLSENKKFENFFKEKNIKDNDDEKIKFCISTVLKLRDFSYKFIGNKNLEKIYKIGKKIIDHNGRLKNDKYYLPLVSFRDEINSKEFLKNRDEVEIFLNTSGNNFKNFELIKIPIKEIEEILNDE